MRTIQSIFLLCALILSCSHAGGQANNKPSINIGIGYFTDSTSNLSDQYAIYKLLADNPLYKKDTTAIIPMLTMRRGLTEYYINGSMNARSIRCNLWHSGKLQTTIRLTATNKSELLSALYNRINELIGDNLSGKERRDIAFATASRPIDRLSAKMSNRIPGNKVNVNGSEEANVTNADARYNMPLYSKNSIPPLSYYGELVAAHVNSVGKLDPGVKDYLLSSEFEGLSPKGKRRYIAHHIDRAVARDLYNMYPQPKKKNMPVAYNDNIDMAGSVAAMYDTATLNAFLFTSKFIAQNLRDDAKKVALPLWKRQGTVVTYIQAGINFNKQHMPDVAIHCLSSALLMVDGLSVCPSMKHYFKSKILEEMAGAYQKNEQGASAYLCNNLAQLHHTLQYSEEMTNEDESYRLSVDKLTEFFTQVEADAKNAQGKSRTATWGAIFSAAGPDLVPACNALNGCATGNAKVTNGFHLPAKYIIHAVGPVWQGGRDNEERLLYTTYTSCLQLAIQHNIKSIAFPNISTGIYGFPKQAAAEIAIRAVSDFCNLNQGPEEVLFICYDHENYAIYQTLLNG